MAEQNRVIIDADYRDLIPGYIRSRKTELETIEDRVNEKDFTYLKRLSHDWHGTGESYCIPFISEIGKKMNRAANAGDGDAVLALAGRLSAYLETIEIRYE